MEGEGGVAVRGVAILEVVQEGPTATHLEEEVALVASQGGWGGIEGGREGERERGRERGREERREGGSGEGGGRGK